MRCWFFHNWKISDTFEANLKGKKRYGKEKFVEFHEDGHIQIERCFDCDDQRAFFINQLEDKLKVSIHTARKLLRDRENTLNETWNS
jgi:hypothetical protein